MITTTRERTTGTHRERGRAREEHRRSLSDLVRDLRDETFLLVRQEVALARTEMSEKASKVGRNVIYTAVGGAIGFAGLMILLLAATAGVFVALLQGGVDSEIALWLAPLIVGAVVALVGYIFFQKGISTLKHESAAPERTIRSLKEDKQWLKRSMT